jgi:hypothetical protein
MQTGWAECFKGGWKRNENLRRTCVGVASRFILEQSSSSYGQFVRLYLLKLCSQILLLNEALPIRGSFSH